MADHHLDVSVLPRRESVAEFSTVADRLEPSRTDFS
jgi:hypothetical protein